jgi:hypothetical protein
MIARVVKVAATVGGIAAVVVLFVMAGLSTVTRFTAAAWLVALGAAFAAGVCLVLVIALTAPRPRPGWWWHR